MLVAGVHEGKNEINARIGYFKLGINLKTEKPTARQILNGVTKILTNSTYQTNVKRLSEEFNRYDPGVLCQKYIASVLRSAADHKSTSRGRGSDLLNKYPWIFQFALLMGL